MGKRAVTKSADNNQRFVDRLKEMETWEKGSCSFQTKGVDFAIQVLGGFAVSILEKVCVIGRIYFNMIVQEQSKPCDIQLQAKAVRSRARGGEGTLKYR